MLRLPVLQCKALKPLLEGSHLRSDMLQLCVCNGLPKRLVVVLPTMLCHRIVADLIQPVDSSERTEYTSSKPSNAASMLNQLTRASALTFKPCMPGRRRIAASWLSAQALTTSCAQLREQCGR